MNIGCQNHLDVSAKSTQSNADRQSITPTAKELQIDLRNINTKLSIDINSELNSGRRYTKASSELDFMIFTNCTNIAT